MSTTTTKTIKINGHEYELPPLTIKQNKHVEPLVAKHAEFFVRVLQQDNIGLHDLTEERSEDFTTIVFYAMTRIMPALTRKDFDEWPIGMREILQALGPCLVQSQLFREAAAATATIQAKAAAAAAAAAAAGAPPTAPGEQPTTGEAASPSTGTGS
jgi:hypothetical protein